MRFFYLKKQYVRGQIPLTSTPVLCLNTRTSWEDFHLDLLFYHRILKRLVAIELKLGKFEAKHKGQMELYLKWLDKHEKQEGENPPVGLILCAESSREQIELLEMHKDGIMVAEYWTELPPKKQLEQKIHSLLVGAKERMVRDKLLKSTT